MGDPTLKVRDPITALLRRDRWVVLGGLAALTLITAVESRSVGDAMMRTPSPLFCVSPLARWGPAELATIALMWSVMMVAMMTPTASPMVLAFAGLERRRIGGTGAPWGTTSTFLSGYLLVWMGFSVLATLAQWGLHSAAMLSAGGMKMASSSIAAVLLVSAGVFQFSSAKSACLKHCRTPVGFLLSEWRAGVGGALVMGVRHGLYCVGCCWLLMLLLFVAGVMNAAWCAALAALVLAERVLPGGLWLARAVGVVLALSGGGLAAGIW
jgi:predicted metal-binding membrane protein